ncbi:MAG TPA: DUF4387 domain-containing protein [Ramlibacter sp.]|uniref:DUF4387 domain-containing protein n=1 Tax=Ramlibacter sp. TaxID=1917967 RepID=UPI002C2BE35B|nr:DUF4387 domain-containing protein [Ramlibacter sp.]HVZ45193.1 DUF4387 domain-containing protein [Ramlibacter sp.]
MQPARPIKLGNLAAIVRSKNAGPYRLTFDVLFDREENYLAVSRSGALSAESVARAYGVDAKQVSSFFEIPVARAFKITFVRPHAQCGEGETDVYGAQQHVPLMNMLIPVTTTVKEFDDV